MKLRQKLDDVMCKVEETLESMDTATWLCVVDIAACAAWVGGIIYGSASMSKMYQGLMKLKPETLQDMVDSGLHFIIKG